VSSVKLGRIFRCSNSGAKLDKAANEKLTRAFLTLFRLDVNVVDLKRLRRPAPATVKDCVGRDDPRHVGSGLVVHDRDEGLYRLDAMGPRQQTGVRHNLAPVRAPGWSAARVA
jgi:hypothetical protein